MRQVTYGEGGFDPTKPNNNIVEEIEIDAPLAPLRDAAVLATLLATLNIVNIEDAARACGLTPDDLVQEALAWALFRDS